ncbi:MAG: sarcosine oxidase subunit gamma family protein [Kiloniellales bacterium]|nr:sarcosine oxidase subunit gamma family protein [Kiloniellales bacterium]
MADLMIRQSALAQLGLDGRARPERGEAGVALAEKPFRAIVNLRGNPEDAAVLAAVEGALGLALPLAPNTTATQGKTTAFWLGPDEWWIVTAEPAADHAARLRTTLAGLHAAVTEVGESRSCIEVSGPRARDLLAKACPLDLHPRVFAPGACAQSQLAKTSGLLHQTSEEPAYDLYVLRSFAEYLWHWLEDAGQEYGVAVVRRG